MQPKHNKQLVPLAKQLRKEMTKEERHLWYDFLRSYPVRFSRQKVLGKYIADFYCAEAKLVIELDGSQHYEDRNIKKDADRTAFLEGYGLRVIRIPNNDVGRNFCGVCEYIDAAVKQSLSQLRWQLPHRKKSAIYFSNPAEFYPFQKEFENLLQKTFSKYTTCINFKYTK